MSNVTAKVELNMPRILSKVENQQFGTFLANEWYRLISPYTPRDTGLLMETVAIKPFEIKYIQPYSAVNYYGDDRKFRKEKNPFASAYWDKAAENAGQKDKLIKAANKYLGGI